MASYRTIKMICIDCGEILRGHHNDSIRCKSCARKYQYRINPDSHPMKGKIGKESPNFKNKSIRICELCKKPVTGKSKLCRECWHLIYHIETSYCIDCGKKISHHADRCVSCSKKGKLSSHFGKPPKNIKRVKYNNIWMRSTWEVAYAKYLDRNNVKWLYESKTFDLGDCTYTPDFYLPEINKYIEIKGYWYKKSLNKFIAFKLLYPEFNIEVFNTEKLTNLEIIGKKC